MAGISWQTGAILLTAVLLARASQAQQIVRPYDGIQAGYDAFQLAEEKRQINVGQQLYLNDRMRALATPLATYGYGYGPYLSTYGIAPASREYAYAYGNSPQGYAAARYTGRPLTVFEPWPYVPGDIWGDFYTPPHRQPVAQVQTQTGKNRWESHPVYDPPLASYPVSPPVNSRALDGTPYATKRAAQLPSAPAPRRPTVEHPPIPEPPSPGPSIDDEPARPQRRVF